MLWAIFFGQSAKPVDQLCVPATVLNQTIKMVATGATALLTVHVQHIEFADEIAEDDCAVAGHGAMIAWETWRASGLKKEVARRRPVFQRRKDARAEVWSRGGQGSISFGIKKEAAWKSAERARAPCRVHVAWS